mmetsp:Transcript_11862/g.24388  ORF Transcript_11862/g.24388 Transcript_11862/m.24388 type:complete len:225 (-) Transcript_11862:430-1104(-)
MDSFDASSQSTVGKRYLAEITIFISARSVGCSFQTTSPILVGAAPHMTRPSMVTLHQNPGRAIRGKLSPSSPHAAIFSFNLGLSGSFPASKSAGGLYCANSYSSQTSSGSETLRAVPRARPQDSKRCSSNCKAISAGSFPTCGENALRTTRIISSSISAPYAQHAFIRSSSSISPFESSTVVCEGARNRPINSEFASSMKRRHRIVFNQVGIDSCSAIGPMALR